MEEMTMQQEALSLAQKNMRDFFENHDLKYLAEDAVYKNLNTGETHRGKTDIGAMLHYMYQVAFDARMEITGFIITEDRANLEGLFKGRHIGEFAGIKATNREVNVPISISYDLKDGLIKEARIYMIADTMKQQLGVSASAPQQKTTYIMRDIFQLKFGKYREAKKLLEKAMENKLMPETQQMRVLTDFTGDAYRLIFEEGFDSLTDYEISLNSSIKTEEWQQWYELFKPNVERSYREILKQVM